MKNINSFLAIVLSILLAQAVDPPYQTNLEETLLSDHQLINRLLQSNGRSQYARLLQREEIQPLLKLYATNNFTKPENIKEEQPDVFEDQEKIDLLLRRSDFEDTTTQKEVILIQSPQFEDRQTSFFPTNANRKDGMTANHDQTNFGSTRNDFTRLLPSKEFEKSTTNYDRRNDDRRAVVDFKPSVLLSVEDSQETFDISTKRYEFASSPEQPINIPRQNAIGEIDARFQTYEPTTTESLKTPFYPNFDRFSPEPPRFEPLSEDPRYVDPRFHRFRAYPGFRSPRKLPQRDRGNRELYQESFAPSGRDAFLEHGGPGPWKGSWRSRGPRVIFPSDLVSFRDQEQDLLLGDQNLQDLQEPERDFERGELFIVKSIILASLQYFLQYPFAAPGVTTK